MLTLALDHPLRCRNNSGIDAGGARPAGRMPRPITTLVASLRAALRIIAERHGNPTLSIVVAAGSDSLHDVRRFLAMDTASWGAAGDHSVVRFVYLDEPSMPAGRLLDLGAFDPWGLAHPEVQLLDLLHPLAGEKAYGIDGLDAAGARRTAGTAGMFGWADGVPLYGSMLSEVKVTDIDTDNEGSPGGGRRDCDPGSLTWPYSTADLANWYTDTTNFDEGLWSLNSARDTVDIMLTTNQNIYIADVNGSDPYIIDYWDRHQECNWYSLAALDDHIQARLDAGELEYPVYTGILIGPGEDVAGHSPGTFSPWIRRARLEAADHPDILKVVVIDELYRLMDGPETVLYDTCDEAHWTRFDVGRLRQMTRSALAPLSSGSDVELWARMVDVAVLRYVVPSSVLGVPADPEVVFGKPTTVSGDYEFDGLGAAYVEWAVGGPLGTEMYGRNNWLAWVEFVYATGAMSTATAQDLVLHVYCNGTSVNEIPVIDSGHDPEVIHFAYALLDSTALGEGAWDRSARAFNSIVLALIPSGSTDHDVDRTVWISAVRVVFYDTDTGSEFWSSGYLDHGTASHGLAGTLPLSGAALATDNERWRISRYLDGVAVTHDVTAESGYVISGFERLLRRTRSYLHDHFDRPRRCLVDERAQVFDPDSVEYMDTGSTYDRMEAAAEHADGVLATYLPMEIENLASSRGRFTARTSLDSAADAMVYEARLTRTWLGETHEWQAATSVSGTYTVRWEVHADVDEPNMRWFVRHLDGLGNLVDEEEGTVEEAIAGSASGEVTLEDVSAGDILVVGWTGDWPSGEGGSSVRDASYVLFTTTPPSSSPGLSWTYQPSLDTSMYPEVQEMYDCITTWFTTGSGSAC